MKVVISHVFSDDNKGDAALLSVLVDGVKQTFKDADIKILTIDTIKPGQTFEGYPVEQAFMYHAYNRFKHPVPKAIHSFFIMGSTLLWAYGRKHGLRLPLPKKLQPIASTYDQADLIIPVGGGYLRGVPTIGSTILLMLMLHPLVLARVLGKPVTHYAQSVGPFGNRLQSWLAARTLRKVDLVVAREDISFKLLKDLGIKQNVKRAVDGGFLFQGAAHDDLRATFNIPASRPVLGITVRKWLKVQGQESYEQAVAELADYAIKKYKAFVVFVPQVTAVHHKDDDREAGQRVFERMAHKKDAVVMRDKLSHHSIKAMYASLDYIVGTRFHSVIFALTARVPAIAIEYEYKTRGIMRDLGLEGWVLPIESVKAAELKAMFDQLVVAKKQYVHSLNTMLPQYIERASDNMKYIKAAYVASQKKK